MPRTALTKNDLFGAPDARPSAAENLIAHFAKVFDSRQVTVGHADLTDPDNGDAQAVAVGDPLPANAHVVGCAISSVTPFSGGGATACVLTVGGTDTDGVINDLELITDAPTEAELNAARGLGFFGPAGGQQINATFTPDGGHNLAGLTAGSVTITVYYTVIS